MRQAITLFVAHGEAHLRVLSDGSVPIEEQRQAFKALKAKREHPEFSRIELWTSGGVTKSHKFREPAGASKPGTTLLQSAPASANAPAVPANDSPAPASESAQESAPKADTSAEPTVQRDPRKRPK